tara:strand:- start:355 stop:1074 length:720 start_codon:yes stop_codon:yes gene_type:complete
MKKKEEILIKGCDTIRIFDLLISCLAILLLGPAMLIICIVLSVTGERKIIFTQRRHGRHGEMINIFKFVTMLENSPNIGSGTVTVKNDPRVLPVGAFLRRTKLNELPQFFNVLRGDLSLIGPRPQEKRCFDTFTDEAKIAILKVRPGLSGIGSIIFRNEDELLSADNIGDYDTIITPYKGSLEIWYVKNKSVKLYFVLLALTFAVLIWPNSKLPFQILHDLPLPSNKILNKLVSNKYVK